MRSRVNLIAVLLLGGCGYPTARIVEAPPGAAEAIAYAWGEYGSARPAPEVVWIEGECDDGLGFWDRQQGLGCVAGEFFPAENRAYVTIFADQRAGTIAHELLHGALSNGIDADPNHTSSRWGVDDVRVAKELYYVRGF